MYRKLQLALIVFLVSLLAACGGGGGGGGAVTPTYKLGGVVSGLPSGASLTLNDGVETWLVLASGNFTFPTQIADKASYAVTVASQPTGYTCSISGGAGTVSSRDVSTVIISCLTNNPTYTLGGSVTGLPTGANVVLTYGNVGDTLTITQSGAFSFATAQADKTAYTVAVSSQSNNTLCTVSSGSGNVNGANVTSVSVACIQQATYTVGVTVSGLPATNILVLNEGDKLSSSLTINQSGAYVFSSALPDKSAYNVTVTSQPSGYSCTVVSGSASGTISAAPVTNIVINCAALSIYAIGGSVAGLPNGRNVVLQLNAGTTMNISQAGAFSFKPGLVNGAGYAVTVSSQPNFYTCIVTNGSGTLSGADISNISVTCTPLNSYTIAGNIYGVPSSGKLTISLTSNGINSGVVTVAQSGPFTFTPGLADASPYVVSVSGYPSNYTCSVANASGTLAGANITNVIIYCLSADQVVFESSELINGEYQIIDNLPASTTTPVSGTNYMYDVTSGGLRGVTPLLGPQTEVLAAANMTSTLALPSFNTIPTRVLLSQFNAGLGKYVPVIFAEPVMPFERVTSYVGASVRIDTLDATNSVVTETELRNTFASNQLTGLLSTAPSELSSTFDFYKPFSSNASLLNASASFATGSAYYKYKKTRVGDTVFVQDCVAPGSTAKIPLGCATGTLTTFFPFTSPSNDATGSIPWADGTNGNALTYQSTDGTITTIQGASVWVANTPRSSLLSATQSYRAFIDLGTGVIYAGLLQKDQTPIGQFQNNTIIYYFLGFNKAASDSLKAGLTF